MKKLLMLSLFIPLLFFMRPTCAYWSDAEHKHCLPGRWVLCCYYSSQFNPFNEPGLEYSPSQNELRYSNGVYYDADTVERENRFIPFADRKIKIWVAVHWRAHHYYGKHYTEKARYEINLDEKTYRRLAPQEYAKALPIEPDSMQEFLFNKSKKLFYSSI